MPYINLNEIRLRASKFVNEWKDLAPKAREEADAQQFQTEFLDIFGITRKQVATFEHRVNIGGQQDFFGNTTGGHKGYIDLFWKGHFMIEMKTPGKDMKKAYEQAKEYAVNLPPDELPVGILISDFCNFDYYNLEKDNELAHFTLAELPEKVDLFTYLAGYKENKYKAVSDVDIEAAEHMGELHDALKESKYTGHQLEMYLVRLLFCLFADDTGIFDEKKLFFRYIEEKTNKDGSDLAIHLGQIFDILNKPKENRLTNIDETLDKFPYVNGGLFEEKLETAAFNSTMRNTLLKCCELDWSKIKPEIFGAMFQSVKDKESRRELGEHYTSETNILKVIQPLFLDSLWEEFEKIRKYKSDIRIQRLLEFHTKLRQLKFLDPACGCGNFLVVTYRELRLLELDVLSEYLQMQKMFDIDLMVRVNVDQFYGIELEEFPARIAQTALWLMDHLMNLKASVMLDKYIVRIPLTASPTIRIDNALTTDWEKIVPKDELSYILGNPPFVGANVMSKYQKEEIKKVFNNINYYGILDYVTCWYKKSSEYIKNTKIEVGFVSTNSICQGEQVPALWSELMNKHNIHINFAHKTFKWGNEAKGKAAVYCVIIGFSLIERKDKLIFEYPNLKGDPIQVNVKRINGYLLDAPDIWINPRTIPLSKIPEIRKGNYYAKSEGLIIEEKDYDDFISKEPNSLKYIKKLIGSEEFINNKKRFCLWLVDCPPDELHKMPLVMERINKVKLDRLSSKDIGMKKLALTPTVFRETNNPDKCLVIPVVSSENRTYIPIGFINKDTISTNANLIIPDANIYHFGILTSTMHMAWVRYVCGRLKSDYRYSKDIVYNNFPFPDTSEKQKSEIEKFVQEILDARLQFPSASLSNLYDPLTMPIVLLKAHQKLDKAVEAAYGRTFNNDSERVAYLFELYQKLINQELSSSELFTETKKTGKGRKL